MKIFYRMTCWVVFSFLTLNPINWANAQSPNIRVHAQSFTFHDEVFLAILMDHPKDWHTYWQNPGDSGMPTTVDFYSDLEEKNKVDLKALPWPVPHRFLQKGDILSYGHEKQHALFFYLKPEEIKKFESSPLTVKVQWLACEKTCIPEEMKLVGSFQQETHAFLINEALSTGFLAHLSYSQDELEAIYRTIPEEIEAPSRLDFKMALAPDKKNLRLYTTLKQDPPFSFHEQMGFLTPFQLMPFNFYRERIFLNSQSDLVSLIDIGWDGEFENPPRSLPLDGICLKPWIFQFLFQDPSNGKFYIIKKELSSFLVHGQETTQDFFKTLTPLPWEESFFSQHQTLSSLKTYQNTQNQQIFQSSETSNTGSMSKGNTSVSFLFMLAFAFIGGLILNFMPCVLPVISLKLFGLIKHSQQTKGAILRHNLAYSFGVLFSFFILALVVVILKMTGDDVGWGFQLQSPLFVGTMVAVLFFFSLNLFGLYEFKTPGGNFFGQMKIQDGLIGDFISGILATVLSTPCSAPFLGTALTFAFTSSILTIFVVFFFIGLGLSFPFLMTGFFPKTIAFLPKPGLWMEHLKKFLGLSLLLTMVWLFDVLLSLTSSDTLLKFNLFLLFSFFALYFWLFIGKKIYWKIFFLIPAIIFFYFFCAQALHVERQASSESAALATTQQGDLSWVIWSWNLMQADGNLKFVDFSAKWCMTCKMNERLVIHTDAFEDLIKKHKAQLILGDWTKRDPVMGSWLKSYGHVGVPAYFVISPKGKIFDLGETISITKIEKSLMEAMEP